MTRKALMERAHVLNVASLQAQAALAVVATLEEARPEVETASFKCGACSTVFATNAGAEPFCISCGSEHVTAETSDGLPPGKLPGDAELSAYVCTQCSTYNVLSTANVSHLKSHAHCVACGTVHTFDLTAEAEDQQQQDPEQQADQQQVDQQQQDQQQATTASKVTTKPGATPQTAGGGLENFGDKKAPPIDQQASEDDEQGGEQGGQQGQQQQQEQDASKNCADVGDDTAVETVPLDDEEVLQDDSDVGAQQMFGEDQTARVVEVSLLAAAIKSNPKAVLELSHTGTHLLAMVDGLHVATLAGDARPEFAGVFDKAPFSQSILRAAEDHGVVAALDSYGFVKTKVKVPMAQATAALIKRGVADKTKALATTTESLTGDLRQSLSIAAAALNKGYWRNRANPLKDAMAQALANLGVQNPNRVVANVFATAGEPFVKTLLEAALELSAKSVEFRNELATNVLDMSVQTAAAGDDEEDDGDHEYRAAANFDVPAIAKTQPIAASTVHQRSAPVTSISAIRASAGGSLFRR